MNPTPLAQCVGFELAGVRWRLQRSTTIDTPAVVDPERRVVEWNPQQAKGQENTVITEAVRQAVRSVTRRPGIIALVWEWPDHIDTFIARPIPFEELYAKSL